jgi:hypothetical protein
MILKGAPVRHDLPSGAWAEMRPVQDLKGKDRDRFELAVRMQLPRDDEGGIDADRAITEGMDSRVLKRDAAIACFVTAWSFLADDGEPLPVPGLDEHGAITHRESVGDYPLDDATTLDGLLAPLLAKLAPPDPKEATTSASNGRSRAKASSLRA